MPKTDTTGQHHSFEDLMRKYHEGIENLVYAAEVECGMDIPASGYAHCPSSCPFREQLTVVKITSVYSTRDAIRTAIGPQKIRTDVH